MDLVLVRHAQPEHVVATGGPPADPVLTPAGHDQARQLAAWLVHEHFDVVLTSPLRRAQQTAAPVAEALGVEARVADSLAEYDRDSDEYIPMEIMKRDHPERLLAMAEGRWEEYGGEDPRAFARDVQSSLDSLIGEHPGQRVLAVCHGGWINVALATVIGIEPVLWFEPQYTSLHRIRASRTGVRSTISVNETAHLEARREQRGDGQGTGVP